MEMLIGLLSLVVSAIFGGPQVSSPSQEALTSSHTSPASEVINYQDIDYRVYYFVWNKESSLNLVYNLDKLHSASEAYELSACQYLINGGFYSPENTPIGWLETDNATRSAAASNVLFNAYIYLTPENSLKIANQAPQTPVTFGLQSGPQLIRSNQALDLKLKQDKYARRSFIAKTNDDQVVFGMITLSDNVYSGPKLIDMARILVAYGIKTNQPISQAVNLDGGSASAFITPDLSLSEFKPIGSFFCIK